MINVAFVGNPNVGKTALINQISHASLKMGNWPGVTIEKKEVFFKVEDEDVKLIDLPGIYNLSISTAEERVSRDFLLDEKVDVIINVLDSTSLEKNIYLTALLKELDIPVVMALNFEDEFKRIGYELDVEKFEKQLGVPVVFTSGRSGAGVGKLMEKAVELYKKNSSDKKIQHRLPFEKEIEDNIKSLKDKLENDKSYEKVLEKYPVEWLAIKILEDDSNVEARVKSEFGVSLSSMGETEKKNIENRYGIEPQDALARERYGIVRGIISMNLKRGTGDKFALTDKIDKILLNKFFGGIAFLAIIYAVFVIVFDGSSPFIDWIDGFFSDFVIKYVGHAIEGVPDWLSSFILDGILAGVGSVLTFVPLMFFIYFFMAILEESGYMARVAFILNKMMTKVGLSGKAFIPMLIGFGCTVPAIYSTRTLEDEKTRRLTGVIATFMSCGARLPVYSLLAAAFFSKHAAIVVVSIYVFGVFMALLVAFVLKRFKYFKGNNTELLIELPPYRLPGAKAVWHNMKSRTFSYIKKATTIVLGILLIIWFFQYFPNKGDAQNSYIGQAAKVVQPVFKPTGFGDRWEPVASIVPSIIAKETVVGFLGQILLSQGDDEKKEYNFMSDLKDQIVGLGGAAVDSIKSLGHIATFKISTLEMKSQEELDQDAGGNIIPAIRSLWNDKYGQLRAYSFMLYVLLVVPCAVAMGALKQEFGWKLLVFQVSMLLILPYVVSTLFFNIARLFI
ncbi:ferrous iron transport protein B [Leptotrichia shahii]|uniref:ferrous iron transport protein B n=1 Tax=Leptotrichia shahii TaxID=157691 RepID=UPI0028D38A0C|nr:ferrous iron transport protein B [Leptotrichia shahii]